MKLRGGNRQAFNARDREILVEGPRGTGKTYAILFKLHRLAMEHPGFRALIVRKHAVTLTATALRTFDEQIKPQLDGVRFFGGSKDRPAAYTYPNGSTIAVGGLGDADQAEKVKSSEYDVIYVNEATELGIDDWQSLLPLLRHMIDGKPVIPNQRIIADCNPAHASHWLNKRCEAGITRRIRTQFADNPAFVDDDGSYTEMGQKYVEQTLGALSGPKRESWLLGLWTGHENAIYPHFDRALHVRPLEDGLVFKDGAFGADYGRVHKAAAVAVSVDQYGRRWVREAWGRPDTEQGAMTRRVVGQLRSRYALRRGRTDPTQDVLAGNLGAHTAKSGEGSRQNRVNMTGRLLNVFPGGLVPNLNEDIRDKPPRMVVAMPDSPGLLFVQGAPGIDELCDQIEGYHYEHKVTDTKDEMVVARIDEDLVAALEYAIEELEEPHAIIDRTSVPLSVPRRRPQELFRSR